MSAPLRPIPLLAVWHSDPSIRVAYSLHSHLRHSPQCLPVARTAKAARCLPAARVRPPPSARDLRASSKTAISFQNTKHTRCSWEYRAGGNIYTYKEKERGTSCQLPAVTASFPTNETVNRWNRDLFFVLRGIVCVCVCLCVILLRETTHARTYFSSLLRSIVTARASTLGCDFDPPVLLYCWLPLVSERVYSYRYLDHLFCKSLETSLFGY